MGEEPIIEGQDVHTKPIKAICQQQEDSQVLKNSNPRGLLHKEQQEAPRLQYSVAQIDKTDGRRRIREFPMNSGYL